MPIYRHQVITKTGDALPENYMTNTLYSQGANLTDATTAMNLFADYFIAIGSTYSTLVQQNNHEIKVYDMGDPKPRAPVQQRLWNLASAPSNAPAPPELSVCLSFQADPASGATMKRRRGRIYVGMLRLNEIDASGRPITALRTRLATAATTMLAAFDTGPAISWVVWSTVNESGVDVTNGWVDDEFDIQRRRGRKATARTVWT